MAASAGAGVAADRPGNALSSLLQAALALPVLVLPMRAGAVQSAEAGAAVLSYRERGLMKVTEPVAWVRLDLDGQWEFRASGVVDIVSGASPRLVTNQSGDPVQSLTGASIRDRRVGGELGVSRRIGDVKLGLSHARSDEDDYRSRAVGIQAAWELDERLTTITAAVGQARDRVGSAENPALDEPRRTTELLLGVARVLSPVAVVQTSVQTSRGRGWYNDPYKLTLTFPPGGGLPVLARDVRPDHRASVAWLTRYRHRFASAAGTLQAEYRHYRDGWGIRAHAIEAGWSQDLPHGWALRPALRYATQSAASFYSPTVPLPVPAAQSSDQRLAAYGSLSPSIKVTKALDWGFSLEASAGWYVNAARFRPGGGTPAFETLRAYYVLVGVKRDF